MLEQNDRYMTQESAEVSAAKKRFQIMKKKCVACSKKYERDYKGVANMVLSALYGLAPKQHCQTSGLAGIHVYMTYTMIVMAQIKHLLKI